MPIESPDAKNGNIKLIGYDDIIRMLWDSHPDIFYFQLEGIVFKVQQESSLECANILSAEIGYIPFTQESALKRRLLTTVAESASVKLSNPKFNVGEDGKITVYGKVPFKKSDPPETNFARMVVFLQQVLPYAKLIGVIL